MANTLTWTLLPRGFDRGAGKVLLSLFAQPALDTGTGTLAGTPLQDWPALVNGLGALHVQVLEGGAALPAERVGQASSAGWVTLFPPTTPVGSKPGDDGPFSSLVGSFDYAGAHAEAAQAYATALATSPTETVRPDSPVARRLMDVAEALDAARSTGRAVQGSGLAQAAHFLRPAAPAAKDGAQGPGPVTPAPLTPVDTVEDTDIHGLLGLILDHPELARHLGLVIHLAVPVSPALRGERTIRIATATGGSPLLGPFPVVNRMWSRTRLDPDAGLFTMVTRPGARGTEVVNGMLDMSPTSSKYLVGTIDVTSAAQDLAALGARLRRTQATGTQPDDDAGADVAAKGPGLPPRRDTGFTVVQTGRRDGAVQHALEAKARLTDIATRVEGQPVLFADDVTAGYRFDVSRDDGPFRSLMRRVASYHLGEGLTKDTLVARDEGVVAPIVPVQQELAPGAFRLSVGEDIAGWAGWALAAPMPGRAVLAEAHNGPTVTDVEAQSGPYALTTVVRAEPGTVERLRYGSVYTFRGRAVTLAGDSLSVEEANGPATRGLVSKPTLYPRTLAVAPPVLVPKAALKAGETLTRIVVTSDGEGNVLSGLSERHLAPPPGSVELAERHGLLDDAFGPQAGAPARAAMLAVAKRESGSFTDVTVPGPNGTPVPAQGIGVAGPDGPGVTLPVPPGQPLPAGQYVFHATDSLLVPYLADFGAAGACLIPIPSEPGAASVARYGGRWPDVTPARLRLAAATGTKQFSVTTGTAGGRSVIDVVLPAGTVVDVDLASPVREEVLDVMGELSPATRALAEEGQVLLLSPRQRVQIVHATRKPLGTITRTNPTTNTSHATRVLFEMDVLCHGASTARVDLVGTWNEIVDQGFGPVKTVERKAVLGSQEVPKTMLTTPMRFSQEFDFGDTLRRDLKLELVGTTRFRDCFPELAEGDPLTQRRVGIEPQIRPSTARPAPPDVAMIVPTYRWTRTHPSPGTHISTRDRAGVRIWLRRPWMTTGTGEQLGVVAWVPNMAVLDSQFNDKVVSRWGIDLLEEKPGRTGPPLLATNFGNGGTPIAIHLPGAPGGGQFPQPRTAVVPYDVQFDPDRGEWFADVDVVLPDPLPAFVRLAVVRLQQHSTNNPHATFKFNSVSPIVTSDWIPLLAPRTVTITSLSPNSNTLDVDITVTGRHTEDRFFVAEVLARPRPATIAQPPSFNPTDVTTLDGRVTTSLLTQTLADKTFKATGRLTLPNGIDPQRKAELLAGRIVVREMHSGYEISTDAKTSRVEWLETMSVVDARS